MCERILRVKPKGSSVVLNGFDLSEYKDVEPILNDRIVFVCSGDWKVPSKRIKTIILSYVESNIPSKLIVFGDIDEKYKKYCSPNKQQEIVFCDKQPISQIVAQLKSQPTFLHFSYVEACPNSVVEALSCGCPVICNNIGGAPELVDKDGIIVHCDNNFVFKRRAINLTPSHRNRITRAIRNSVNCEWDIKRDDLKMEFCAQKYLNVFKRILS